MRELSELELVMVAGGGLWEEMTHWFQNAFGQSGNSSGSGTMQTVVITGQRMSDIDKFAYDMERIRASLPDCTIQVVISGVVTQGTVSAGGTLTGPSVNGQGQITRTSPQWTYNCPPKSGIPQHPSNLMACAA